MLKPNEDAWGKEIRDHFLGKTVCEIIERDDGFIALSGGAKTYFAEFMDWPEQQKKAMRFVRGRVLDVGCGAGRVALHLQALGHEVVAIDNSPLALETCRRRGVWDVRPCAIEEVGEELGTFDTIVMLGNNFGLFGSFDLARERLACFHRITSASARIVAESRDPYDTKSEAHLDYHERNRKRNRMGGQLRLRVRYMACKGPFFDYLMVSPEEMERILDGTGWRLARTISVPPIYVAVIEKDNAEQGGAA